MNSIYCEGDRVFVCFKGKVRYCKFLKYYSNKGKRYMTKVLLLDTNPHDTEKEIKIPAKCVFSNEEEAIKENAFFKIWMMEKDMEDIKKAYKSMSPTDKALLAKRIAMITKLEE